MLAAFEFRPLEHIVFHDLSDSLPGLAFFGSGRMPIAGSDRLHTHVEYTRKHSTRCRHDCCPESVCVKMLEVTILAYFNNVKSLTSIQPASFGKPANRRICIKVT